MANDVMTDPKPEPKAKQPKRRANRVAYAEAHKKLVDRVAMATVFLKRAIDGQKSQEVTQSLVGSALDILEGKV